MYIWDVPTCDKADLETKQVSCIYRRTVSVLREFMRFMYYM
jgi:hypothetical protein